MEGLRHIVLFSGNRTSLNYTENPKKLILQAIGNVFFVTILSLFTVNNLIANWNLNPFFDILLARVQGLIFVNAHASSALAVCFVTFYQIIRTRHYIQPYRWVSVIFASAGIHEVWVFFWNFVKFGSSPLNCGCTQDQLWYVFFIFCGIILGTKSQLKILKYLTIYLGILMGVYVNFFGNSDLMIGSMTVSFIVNSFVEVFGWMTLAMGWLFVK